MVEIYISCFSFNTLSLTCTFFVGFSDEPNGGLEVQMNPGMSFKPFSTSGHAKEQQIAFSVFFFSSLLQLTLFSTARKHLYRLCEVDCQVNPRFPVLALFTNHNVFHPPPSLHLHLFIQPMVQRHPLTPLPHRCYVLHELYNTLKQAGIFIFFLIASFNLHCLVSLVSHWSSILTYRFIYLDFLFIFNSSCHKFPRLRNVNKSKF